MYYRACEASEDSTVYCRHCGNRGVTDMDTFNFLVAILLIMLAMQFGENWIVFGVVAIVVFTMRSMATTIMLLVTVFVLYFIGATNLSVYWPIIVVGLVVLSLALGVGGKPTQPEYYEPGGYGDLLGGGMGGI